jgi:hypothetical protein
MHDLLSVTAAVASFPVALGLAWACLNGVVQVIHSGKR